jgi:hypothetical protein
MVSCLVYSLTTQKEAICSSETSADFKRTTQPYIPGDRTLYNHRCKNLRSYMSWHRLIYIQISHVIHLSLLCSRLHCTTRKGVMEQCHNQKWEVWHTNTQTEEKMVEYLHRLSSERTPKQILHCQAIGRRDQGRPNEDGYTARCLRI